MQAYKEKGATMTIRDDYFIAIEKPAIYLPNNRDKNPFRFFSGGVLFPRPATV